MPVLDKLVRADPSRFQPKSEMLLRSKVSFAAEPVTTGWTRRSTRKPSETIGYCSQPWITPGAALTAFQLVL